MRNESLGDLPKDPLSVTDLGLIQVDSQAYSPNHETLQQAPSSVGFGFPICSNQRDHRLRVPWVPGTSLPQSLHGPLHLILLVHLNLWPVITTEQYLPRSYLPTLRWMLSGFQSSRLSRNIAWETSSTNSMGEGTVSAERLPRARQAKAESDWAARD